MKKFCFLTLLVCTLFILCSAHAFAANTADPAAMPPVYDTDAIVIGSVSVTLTAPKIGAYPDYTTELPSGVKYYSDSYTRGNYKNDIIWYDLTADSTVVPDADRFQPGHAYRVTVFLTAQSGYAFNKSTVAKLNGNAANCSVTRAGQLKVEYDFPALPDPISEVSVKLTAPIGGAKPDYKTVLPYGAKYYSGNSLSDSWYQNDVSWYDTAKYAFLTPGSDKFAAGTGYRVIVFLTAKDGYVFSETASATVNGMAAEECRIVDGKLRVKYTFPAAPKAITSVSVKFNPPIAGKKAGYEIVPTSGEHWKPKEETSAYTKNGITWFIGSSVSVKVSDGLIFQSGVQYGVIVQLVPEEGYAFPKEEDMIVKLNSELIHLTASVPGEIQFFYKFPPAPEEITAVSLTITPPKTGEKPDMNPKLPSGAKYELGNPFDASNPAVIWTDRSDGGKEMDPQKDTFIEGHSYFLSLWLVPDEGYVFAEGAQPWNNGVKVSLNGEDTGSFRFDTPHGLLISYSFPAPGDVNNDAKVNRLDYVILSRYLAEWPGYASKIMMSAAELDGKPGITAADRRILGRMVAGKS